MARARLAPRAPTRAAACPPCARAPGFAGRLRAVTSKSSVPARAGLSSGGLVGPTTNAASSDSVGGEPGASPRVRTHGTPPRKHPFRGVDQHTLTPTGRFVKPSRHTITQGGPGHLRQILLTHQLKTDVRADSHDYAPVSTSSTLQRIRFPRSRWTLPPLASRFQPT
jgi:hypothetical protein